MDGSFRIGSLFGIPIYIHYTFLLVIPLSSVSNVSGFADAYGAVLGQPPPGGRKSDLLFQRVQAEIEAGGLQTAPALLDQFGPRLVNYL